MKFSKIVWLIVIALLVLLPVIGFAVPEGFTVIKKNVISVDAILVQMRLRDLNYIAYRPTGRFGGISVYGTTLFQKNNNYDNTGQVGPETFDALFEVGLVRSKAQSDIVIYGDELETVSNVGDAISWTSVDNVFLQGMIAELTDTKTNISFEVRRVGGEGHAHIEPVSESDVKAFYDMFTKNQKEFDYLQSGRLTYEKRPCVLTVGDNTYAASLFGYVHGDDPAIIVDPENPEAEPYDDNTMNGYLCLFFSGSTTDVFNMSDPEHDANIEKSSH